MIFLTAAYRFWKIAGRACEALADSCIFLAEHFVVAVHHCRARAQRIRFRIWERDFDARSKREGRRP